MKRRTTEVNTKRISFLMYAALVTASSLAGQVGASPPPIGDFGLMGGALGQTLRLNVVSQPPPIGEVAPRPCNVLVGFKGIRGATVGPVQQLNLAPGQAGFVELNFNTLVNRLGERLQIQPVVAAVNPGSAVGCSTSAEMYDQLTARTMAYASAFEPPPMGDTPPPIGEFCLIGAALGQTVRLNVLWPPGPVIPSGPARITLGFDIPGFPPGPTRTVDLMPGEGAFLDLPMDGFGLRLGQRVELRPTIAGATVNFRVTAEVYDQLSGRTTALIEPPPHADRVFTPGM
jgi:hypothetical protein